MAHPHSRYDKRLKAQSLFKKRIKRALNSETRDDHQVSISGTPEGLARRDGFANHRYRTHDWREVKKAGTKTWLIHYKSDRSIYRKTKWDRIDNQRMIDMKHVSARQAIADGIQEHEERYDD